MSERIQEPIEGFFLATKENLIFDVKGLSHPTDRVIAFIRYYPTMATTAAIGETTGKTPPKKSYAKVYALNERYAFLKSHYPQYLFRDLHGRGLLQGVPREKIQMIYNPMEKLQRLREKPASKLDALENLALALSAQLEEYIEPAAIGLSGSLLVSLHRETSDVDLIIYGRENGLKIYHAMPEIFEHSSLVARYTRKELETLWVTRGQTNQIDFSSFAALEQHKVLQGTIGGRDFYLRLVLHPDEFYEPYEKTFIIPLGEIEITAEVADATGAIFTPCIYQLKDVELLSSTKLCEDLPERIFTLRGRYCELAKKGDRIIARGKLERVEIRHRKEQYQLVLGTLENEFFRMVD
ncbi:MAG: hypothetical protein ACTSXO_04325 [Candidatus Heimdallarchaeota archaeon]